MPIFGNQVCFIRSIVYFPLASIARLCSCRVDSSFDRLHAICRWRQPRWLIKRAGRLTQHGSRAVNGALGRRSHTAGLAVNRPSAPRLADDCCRRRRDSRCALAAAAAAAAVADCTPKLASSSRRARRCRVHVAELGDVSATATSSSSTATPLAEPPPHFLIVATAILRVPPNGVAADVTAPSIASARRSSPPPSLPSQSRSRSLASPPRLVR